MLPLVCLDVDGTLVGSAGVPSPALWAAAERARGRGQHLTLCTARLAAGPTREWAERLDPDGWHIFHTGAACWQPSTGQVRTVPLGDDALAACADLARAHDWVFEVYSWDDYVVDSDQPLARDHADLLALPFKRRSLADLEGEVVRVQYVVPTTEAAEAIASTPPGTVASGATSPLMPGATFVSVTRDGVSKAAGIETVTAELGVDPDRTMMVGDGHNDLSAVQRVGWGVAMGNADPELIAAARMVVADVENDGAADAIDRSAEL